MYSGIFLNLLDNNNKPLSSRTRQLKSSINFSRLMVMLFVVVQEPFNPPKRPNFSDVLNDYFSLKRQLANECRKLKPQWEGEYNICKYVYVREQIQKLCNANTISMKAVLFNVDVRITVYKKSSIAPQSLTNHSKKSGCFENHKFYLIALFMMILQRSSQKNVTS